MLILLTLLFATAGCHIQSDASAVKAPNADANNSSLDAYQLSGGKITRFTGTPGLPNDPNARALLKACRQLPITSHTAQSVYLIFHSRKGTQPIPALKVGNQSFLLMGSIERMLNGEVDRTTASILNLPGNTKRTKIGSMVVVLGTPIIAIDHGTQTIVTLPDLLALFRASDVQHGRSHEIQYLETRLELSSAEYEPTFDQNLRH